MRIALQRFPIECCGSREELERKKEEIYILEIDGKIIGSVAIYGNEIDDLVVEKSFQGMGYGTALLRFAVSSLQSNHTSPIILHVADWNQSALKIYLKNGFSIVKTEEIWINKSNDTEAIHNGANQTDPWQHWSGAYLLRHIQQQGCAGHV